MDLEKKPRLPPGHHETNRFTVLQKGRITHIEREKYQLKIKE